MNLPNAAHAKAAISYIGTAPARTKILWGDLWRLTFQCWRAWNERAPKITKITTLIFLIGGLHELYDMGFEEHSWLGYGLVILGKIISKFKGIF